MPGTIIETGTVMPSYGDFLVNDGVLDKAQVLNLRQSFPSEPIEELRARYEQDSYVFLKGLIPRSDVLECRKQYFSFLEPTGFLEPGSDPVDGIFRSDNDGSDYASVGAGAPKEAKDPRKLQMFLDLAEKAHKEDWYLKFSQHPALHDFVSRFTGWGENTFQLPRSLLRNNTPKNNAIGVHYDQIFLRDGEPTSVTAWVPLGDIGWQGGGLIYLEKGQFRCSPDRVVVLIPSQETVWVKKSRGNLRRTH